MVFVAGVEAAPKGSEEGCRTVGILLHIFLLQSFIWMGAVAVNVCLEVVFVFSVVGEKLMKVTVASVLGKIIVVSSLIYLRTGVCSIK